MENKFVPRGQVVHSMSEYIHRNGLKWRKVMIDEKNQTYSSRYYDPVTNTFYGKPIDEYKDWLHASEFLKLIGYLPHTLIAPDGEIIKMLSDDVEGTHAGISRHNDLINLNQYYVGDEILVKGKNSYSGFLEKIHGDPSIYTPLQYTNYVELTVQRMINYCYGTDKIVRHSDVAGDNVRGESKGKQDPGRAFHWNMFKYMLELEYKTTDKTKFED